MIISLGLVCFILTILEIVVFILLGDAIGWGETILLAVAIGFVGSTLANWRLRRFWLEGKKTKIDASGTFRPTDVLLHGFLLQFARVLFWTPGFITDVFAIVLLFAPGRTLFFRVLKKWLVRSHSSMNPNANFFQWGDSNEFSRFYHFGFQKTSDNFDDDRFQNGDFSRETVDQIATDSPSANEAKDDEIIDVEFEVRPK